MASVVRIQNLVKDYYMGDVTVNVLKKINLEIEDRKSVV